ncbi:MAG: ornithine cyclodeaminase family protein [Azospirillaceae bacterium]|nr:ornithine cyclodeaminase family protein [Azospirillaceae bacterium]
MHLIDAATIDRVLGYNDLADRLREAFRADSDVPVRSHFTIPTPDGSPGTLLIMPAWHSGGHIGIKIVSVFPDNPARHLPSVVGIVLLLDATTGMPLAQLDGPALTVRRTAAASLLAADHLARDDASRLLVVGTGGLAPHLALAHSGRRPIRAIRVWGRDPLRAAALATRLAAERPGVAVESTADLEAAAAWADIITCATLARTPLIQGHWLRPGCHLDLVGGFTPAMREADDVAIRRARVFVDTRAGAMAEAGDIVQPLASGALTPDGIVGDLFDLTRSRVKGRATAEEITLFKSVGTALEDLAAAELALERAAVMG